MKTLTRISLDELVKTMPIVSEEEQNSYIGGLAPERYRKSCIFDFFNHLDGDRHDNAHYADTAYDELGVSPDASGNISLSYIAKIGEIGGFDVKPYSSSDPFINSERLTKDGNQVMMVITDEDGGNPHSVLLVSVNNNAQGKQVYTYYDQTNGGIRNTDQQKKIANCMYSVGVKSTPGGSTDDTSSSGNK